MKPIDLSLFDLAHLPACDPERQAPRRTDGPIEYTRIQVPVNRPSMCADAPPDDRSEVGVTFDLDLIRLEILRHRNRSEMRALDALVDIERARRAIDKNARIGVVFMVRDPAAFEAINFPGQVETILPVGRSKKFNHGNWLVELLCLDEIDYTDEDYGQGEDDDFDEERVGTFASRAR